MEVDASSGRRRDIVAVVLAASGMVAVFMAAAVALFAGLHCSGGDGGVPYVAGDSPQAGACNATGDGVLLTLVLLVAALALLLLVRRLGLRWVGRAGGPGGFMAIALIAAVLPAGTGLALAPFSAECSAEKEAAWSKWYRAGQSGDPPFKCASY